MADNDILQGFQLGFQSSLQRQRLKSDAALQRLREQQIAQVMALRMQENALAIQERADMAKAVSAAQMAASPTVLVPGFDGEGTYEAPNPQPMSQGDAAVQFVLPVIAKYRPQAVPQTLQGIALMESRAAGTESLIKQRTASTAVSEARVREINERIAQLQKGNKGVDPEFVKNIKFMEERRGTPFDSDELESLWQIQTGQKGRAGTQKAVPTEGEFIQQQLPSARRAERMELKSKYRTDDELIADLKVQYRKIHGDQQQASPEELIYMLDPSGKRVRIKRKDLQRALQQGFKEFEG